jgi:hypothetical protein
METMDAQTANLLIAVVLVALIAVAGWLAYQRNQSHRLEKHFGTEYTRAVDEFGSRSKAEAELRMREKRVGKLNIVPLAPADAERFSHAWKTLQARFVDDPKGAVIEADELVRELMGKRGYPMGDFDSRAADISVDHPAVVNNYRRAQDIVSREQRGQADTEALREAVVCYRALFDDLLEVNQAVAANKMEARS